MIVLQIVRFIYNCLGVWGYHLLYHLKSGLPRQDGSVRISFPDPNPNW